MSVVEIGCCGAYCKTCRAFTANACRGCKLGYENGERDILKAKCDMKVCCMQRNLSTCADCAQYETCHILQSFYQKNGLKYQKYRQATLYIRQCGYEAFIELADKWTCAYGKYL
jgi:hypothetical protein